MEEHLEVLQRQPVPLAEATVELVGQRRVEREKALPGCVLSVIHPHWSSCRIVRGADPSSGTIPCPFGSLQAASGARKVRCLPDEFALARAASRSRAEVPSAVGRAPPCG